MTGVPRPIATLPIAALTAIGLLAWPAPARAAPAPSPPCEVSLVATPAVLALGVDTQAILTVSVTGEGAVLAQPGRVLATVGTVDPLEMGEAPGTFKTVYHLPVEKRPQAALIAVEVVLPSGARPRATLRLPLAANTVFPFKTTPMASVTIEIAGRTFGPAVADAQGNVAIPITVPPGIETGKAVAKGRFGGTKTREISLQTRDYPRLLLLAPPEAEAGAEVAIEAFALDPDASGAAPEDVDLRASAGDVRRVDGDPGLARFLLKLPEFVDEGPVTLAAAMSDGASEVGTSIALHPGPPVTLAIAVSRHLLQVGSNEIEELEVAARDRLGNDTPITGLSVTAGGVPLPLEVTDDVATTRFPAPIVWPGNEKLSVIARLGALIGTKQILLTGGEPTKLRVTGSSSGVAADGVASVDLVAEVSDELGIPTATPRILWSTKDEGKLDVLPSPRFGAYAARFVPMPGVHDRRAVIVVDADPDLRASTRVAVETAQTPNATARVGVLTNLSGSFGQAVFLEGAVPLRRKVGLARLFSFGLSAGYIHSDFSGDVTPGKTGVRMSLNQLPLLGLVRVHVPTPLPVGLSVAGFGGFARAWKDIVETTENTRTRPGANVAMAG
ncbi:MAG TPA: hypothetical protein VHU40_07430, partial [Polyangia bacterium]|nr:hypothetical protein [Polyangia bacterium]